MARSLGGSFGSRVIIDPRKLDAYLKSPSGPVIRDLMRRGQAVKAEAQRTVGVHTPQPGERRTRRPGTLRDSIVTRLVSDPGGLGVAVLVGTNDPVAAWHHEGTRAHTIVPKGGGVTTNSAGRRTYKGKFVAKSFVAPSPRLVFWWPKAGAVVFLKKVNHPGTQPRRFLVNALSKART